METKVGGKVAKWRMTRVYCWSCGNKSVLSTASLDYREDDTKAEDCYFCSACGASSWMYTTIMPREEADVLRVVLSNLIINDVAS